MRDAVLARAARLCFSAAAAPRDRLDRSAAGGALAARGHRGFARSPISTSASARGSCIATRDALAFRHELVRLAIEESLSTGSSGGVAPQKSSKPSSGRRAAPVDAARLAHHAEGADDAEAVLRYAPAAAEARVGARISQRGGRPVRPRAPLRGQTGDSDRSELLERLSLRALLDGRIRPGARDAARPPSSFGSSPAIPSPRPTLCARFPRLLRYAGSVDEAFLTALGPRSSSSRKRLPGRELAMAYSNLSHLYMSVEDVESTAAWADKARALAEQLGDDEPAPVCARQHGAAGDAQSRAGARERVSEIFEHATARHGSTSTRGRTFVMWVWWAPRAAAYRRSGRAPRRGPRVLRVTRPRSLALLPARVPRSLAARPRALGRGARRPRDAVIDDQRSSPMPQDRRAFACSVSCARGEVTPTYGDRSTRPGGLASPTGELQRIEPAVTARAEAAWLEGQASTRRSGRRGRSRPRSD